MKSYLRVRVIKEIYIAMEGLKPLGWENKHADRLIELIQNHGDTTIRVLGASARMHDGKTKTKKRPKKKVTVKKKR